MTSQTLLPTMLRGFFEDYLAAQRDVSQNTIYAYRDACKLFLRYAARHRGRQVIRLQLAGPGPATVPAFPDYLETASLASKLVSPHTIRHSTALHLLQAGVELNVIKSWPGHVSITTTSQYAETDMAIKRKAIERCPPPVPTPEGESPWHARQDIIQWPEDLSAPKNYVKHNPRRPTSSNQAATAALLSST